jgi:signal recognition particle subunit SRP68
LTGLTSSIDQLSKGQAPNAEANQPLTLTVSPDSAKSLQSLVQKETNRLHGLVELEQLASKQPLPVKPVPLIQRFNTFPSSDTALDALVNPDPEKQGVVKIPVRNIEPVPVKPIFLDVAWNYIDYPGKEKASGQSSNAGSTSAGGATTRGQANTEESTETKKKGWFGFGR